jgi:hypothetical protein
MCFGLDWGLGSKWMSDLKKKEQLDQTGRCNSFRIYRPRRLQKCGQLECWTPNVNRVFPRVPEQVLQVALYSGMLCATVPVGRYGCGCRCLACGATGKLNTSPLPRPWSGGPKGRPPAGRDLLPKSIRIGCRGLAYFSPPSYVGLTLSQDVQPHQFRFQQV